MERELEKAKLYAYNLYGFKFTHISCDILNPFRFFFLKIMVQNGKREKMKLYAYNSYGYKFAHMHLITTSVLPNKIPSQFQNQSRIHFTQQRKFLFEELISKILTSLCDVTCKSKAATEVLLIRRQVLIFELFLLEKIAKK